MDKFSNIELTTINTVCYMRHYRTDAVDNLFSAVMMSRCLDRPYASGTSPPPFPVALDASAHARLAIGVAKLSTGYARNLTRTI